MIIKLISYIPAIVGVIAISLVVYSNDSKSAKNRIFVTVNILLGLWLLFLFLADITITYQLAFWFFKLGLIASQLMVLFFYYFALLFPFRSRINYYLQAVISLPMVLLCLLLLTPLGVGSITINSYGVVAKNAGIIYNISDFITLAYLMVAMGVMLSKYKKSDKFQRKQIKVVLIGLLIATLANVFSNIFILYSNIGQNYKFIGNFSIFIFSLFVAYAILKHHLFAIRSVVARSVAYTMSILATVGLYALIVFVLSNYVLGNKLTLNQGIFFAVFSAVTSLAFQPVKRFFDKFSDKIFYRDAYNSQDLLNHVNSSLVGEVDLYNLLNNAAESVKNGLKLEFCNFYVDEKASIDFHVAGTNTKIFAGQNWIDIAKKITTNNKKTISEIDGDDEEVANLLRILRIGAIIKMTSQGQTVGYFVAGQRNSGTTYSSQDLQILEIIADEVAIAVQNNLRYEEIAHFNITLQKEIEEATAKLKKTNEKLVALDEAKDEFISMASHQLRTPLTSMKGYVSMVLDGDAGEISKQQNNLLTQAFASSQRMVYLIADLLNVSRLKTGKFVIEAKPTYLPDVVESELTQLTETVKARELEMIYDKPKEFPTLNLDETKTRQVIMNFVDNAIYYTPGGGRITVKLAATKDAVEFTVTDTGIGVSKADQHHLFTKFYRGGNARKARPDGTGLGLFMAKKVIAAQGGAIIFKTTEGKGSTFGFSFPRAKLEIKTNTPQKSKHLALV